MEKKCIWVIGGDGRQAALAGLLREKGYEVHTRALGEADEDLSALGAAHCVLLPLPAEGERGMVNAPLSEEKLPLAAVVSAMEPGQLLCAGMVGVELERLAAERGVTLRDYFAREELARLNAIPTAEGAIRIAMETLPITLHGARVLVIGMGRIGQELVPRLRGLGAKVTVAARRHEQRARARAMGAEDVSLAELARHIGGFDLVVSTVPAPAVGREDLTRMRGDALVIDLASRPGGVDFAAAEALGVRAIHALALPGKEAPLSAAGYIADTVLHIMKELGL